MRFLNYNFLFIIFSSPAHAQQVPPNHMRTRTIDYTKYDQVMTALPYTPDKIKAARNLLDEANKLFTPEDEEYFYARKIAAIYYELGFDHSRALELIQQAIDAYEKNILSIIVVMR